MRIGTRNGTFGWVAAAALAIAVSACAVSFSEYYEGKGGAGGTGATGTSSNGTPSSSGATQSTSGQPTTGASSPTASSTSGSAAGGAGGAGVAASSSSTGTPLDRDWPNWTMPNGFYDVAHELAPNPDTYQDNGDGTVTDSVTHLMWQQAVDPASYTQSGAVTYCGTTLNNNIPHLGGKTDWRLPTRIELVTLVDFSVVADGSNPTIDASKFPGTPADAFWTATPVAGSPSYAWFVNFNNGGTDGNGMTNMHRVRCVR